MKFDEMTEREQTELLVRHIMKWVYFPIWDVMYTARWALEHDEPISYPYAFWNGQRDGICVFYAPDEHARSFDPLHDLNDAWLVVERIQDANIHVCNAPRSGYVRCAVERYDETTPYFVLGQKAPYVICQAILFAKGVIDAEGNVIEASE